jgi:hypothetical protein
MVRTPTAKLIRDGGVDLQFAYEGSREGDDWMVGGAPPKAVSADTMVLTNLMEIVETELTYEGP